MKTVVLTGPRHDPIIQMMQALNWRVPVRFVDPSELGKTLWLCRWGIHDSNHQPLLAFESIACVINRCLDPVSEEQSMALYWMICLDFLLCPVINRPHDHLKNTSKAFQVQQLHPVSSPFMIPPSWFCYQQNCYAGYTVYKSICHRPQLAQTSAQPPWASSPQFLQVRMQGTNVRIHTWDHNTYAMAIHSQQLDYKHPDAKRQMQAIRLPMRIHDHCLSLAKKLAVPLCGIDCIQVNKLWYLLEINTAPGFSYFDQHDPKHRLLQSIHRWCENQAKP